MELLNVSSGPAQEETGECGLYDCEWGKRVIRINNIHYGGPTGSLPVFNQGRQLRCSYIFFTRTLKKNVSYCGTPLAVKVYRFIRTPRNEEMATCKSATQLPKISPT